MPGKIKYISNSKKGLEREKNQDRIFIIEKETYLVFMIFDGVSSYPFSYMFINEYKKNISKKYIFVSIRCLHLYDLSDISSGKWYKSPLLI